MGGGPGTAGDWRLRAVATQALGFPSLAGGGKLSHSTLSAKLSSAEEDVHSLLNLPLEDAAEAGKFKLSVLARALRAAAAEGSLFDEVIHRNLSC